ncbi:MAG TPA: sulfite exporter TauE/SafE family protein [Tepidisphaeraceae bacterium]|nr:sulfite exporter TauE/SafE family protein [Tepidisphaeraceae bacterium]
MNPLAIIFGAAVGLSLGLTGGGGSILAVPMLVYGLSVSPREAVGISLAAVGATSLAGAIHRIVRGEVEFRTGLMFATGGIAGAPLGTFIGRLIPQAVLLLCFAALMLWVAGRMWQKATKRPEAAGAIRAPELLGPAVPADPPACSRSPSGQLTWSSRCAALMAICGALTGVLSGLFGVGGGFIIVPALVLFTGMRIHNAVSTSLMVIACVSASGVLSYLLARQPLEPGLAMWFVAGGIIGLYGGTLIGRRLAPVHLQKAFAVVIVVVAALVIFKNLA